MEQGLLELEFGDPDIEEINTIFRAARSKFLVVTQIHYYPAKLFLV
jgi:hypothetical protein